MKRLLYFSILGITICLLKRKKPSGGIYSEPAVLRTVGEENRPSFTDWARHTNVSRQYSPEPELAKLSTVIGFELPKNKK